MIQDIRDQAFVQAVEMEQRVVGDNKVRPGMSAAASTDSSSAGESILHHIDNFLLGFGFAVPIGFELERVGPVFIGVIRLVVGHELHRLSKNCVEPTPNHNGLCAKGESPVSETNY